MIEKTLRMIQLYDVYGALLTGRQQEFIHLYYEKDLSLSEVAAEFNISRQAVHDILRNGEATLKKLEQKLGLVENALHWEQVLKQVFGLLEDLERNIGKDRRGLALLAEIRSLLNPSAKV
ncbi:MAG: YlxM family DNA-binding protein [Firmicutes bacterium]|nr:YlxM family DNA-binding protein [Bacillota bacterium]